MTPTLDPKRFEDVPDPFADTQVPELRAPDPKTLGPSPTRPRVRARRWTAIALAFAYEAAVLVMVGWRESMTPWTVALGVFVPLLAAALTLRAVFGADRATARLRLWIAGSFVLLGVGLLLPAAVTDGTSTHGTVRCAVAMLLTMAAPIALAFGVSRHAFPSQARTRAGALGLACGLLGAAALRMHCANEGAVHTLVGHGLPIVVAVVLAALLGARLARA
jgi:hypothetical protein